MPVVVCRICKKDFYVKPSHQKLGWGKYCSTSCRANAQFKGKFVECFVCGNSIYRSPKMMQRSKSGKHFCSKSCQTMWRNRVYTGENSTNWVNGESAYRRILIRSGKEPVCTLCKITDLRILNAHHLDHQRINNKVDNLIWLCLNCHYLVHHDKELEEKLIT